MVQLLRRDRLLHAHQIRQRDHGVAAPTHIDAAQIFWIAAIDVGHLDDHVVLLAFALEARDLAPAEQRLERAAQGLDLDANRGSLVAVDVNFKLRRVELEIGVDIDEARIVGGLVQHLVDHDLQFVIGPRCLDHELDRLVAHTLSKWGRTARKSHDPGDGHHFGSDGHSDFLLGSLPLAPRLELQKGRSLRDRGPAGNHEIALGLRDLREDLLELLGVGVCIFDGGAFRGLDDAYEEPWSSVGASSDLSAENRK